MALFGASVSSSVFVAISLLLLTVSAAAGRGDKYLLGVGKADITGPVVEIGFAGYANVDQVGSGLRQRLHSRAFIVADAKNPDDRFVYLVLDTQSGDTAARYGVLEGLKALGDEYRLYGHNNLALTGTHSHAGPGAWFNYLLPQITTRGFDKQSYQALVDGAVLSIKRAHENLQEVRMKYLSYELKSWLADSFSTKRASSTSAPQPSKMAPSTALFTPT